MSIWYYADAQQHRQGPLSADELALRFQQGHLLLDTLVWREGLTGWQPLGDFSDELGLLSPPAEALHAPLEARLGQATDSPYAPPGAKLISSEPVQSGAEVVHAGFWKRVAASTIDGILLAIVMLVVLAIGAALLGVGMKSMADGFASGAVSGLFILGVYGIPIVLQALYFTWMHASAHQATLGKMAVGIKVVQRNGQRIANGRSLGRWASYFFMHLFSCGITSLVSAFTVGLGQRRQALHDMVADTLVVDRWAFTAHPERQRRELGGVTIAVIILLALLVVGYVVLLGFVGVMAARAS